MIHKCCRLVYLLELEKLQSSLNNEWHASKPVWPKKKLTSSYRLKNRKSSSGVVETNFALYFQFQEHMLYKWLDMVQVLESDWKWQLLARLHWSPDESYVKSGAMSWLLHTFDGRGL